MGANEKPWYADWRVWFCFAVLAIFGLLQAILGIPFRIFDAIWRTLF